jgi:hypothetical protein
MRMLNLEGRMLMNWQTEKGSMRGFPAIHKPGAIPGSWNGSREYQRMIEDLSEGA